MSETDDLKQRIVHSGLIARDELDALAAEADGDLLEFLVSRQRLTEFQATALAAGVAGPFMLGPYRIQERIAAGSIGDLFRAVHVEFDQPVSLKVFPAALAGNPEQLSRMQREVRVAVQLDHPHVVRSFQIGRIGEVYFLAFEDLQGETLETRLSRLGRLPYPEACRLLRQAALGLESLHEAEIAHGDLRPANLWINQHEQLKIMEFGAARDALSFLDKLDETGPSLGASAAVDCRYSAPEAAANPDAADARSDVYALGCTLYHALTGRPPFTHEDPHAQRESHANEAPASVDLHAPDVPQALTDMVARALAKSPDDRPTIGELDWELDRYVDDRRLGAGPTAAWSPDYLAWVQEANLIGDAASPTNGDSESSSEMNEFLDWLVTAKAAPRA